MFDHFIPYVLSVRKNIYYYYYYYGPNLNENCTFFRSMLDNVSSNRHFKDGSEMSHFSTVFFSLTIFTRFVSLSVYLYGLIIYIYSSFEILNRK